MESVPRSRGCHDPVVNEVLRASRDSAALEEKARRAQFEKMKTDALSCGYEVLCDVPADGNCYFHAIQHLLGKDFESSRDLRRSLASFMESKVCLSCMDSLVIMYRLVCVYAYETSVCI